MRILLTIVCGVLLAVSAAFGFQAGDPDPEPPATRGEAQTLAGAPDSSTDDASGEPEWTRPEGPIRIALQAGHWKAADAPDEQAGLRNNGTRGGGKAEWEVNLEIAERTAGILRTAGYVVDILPTTIPPGYWADLFISIHADGSSSPSASGYRAAAPRRDRTGLAQDFADLLEKSYGEATGLPHYPTVTRRMRGYYAFNSRRYRHALHPMTVGVILETGFLTSPRDRRVIVDGQDRAAAGIAEAVRLFLEPNRAEPTLVTAGSSLPPAAVTPRLRPAGPLQGSELADASASAGASTGSENGSEPAH